MVSTVSPNASPRPGGSTPTSGKPEASPPSQPPNVSQKVDRLGKASAHVRHDTVCSLLGIVSAERDAPILSAGRHRSRRSEPRGPFCQWTHATSGPPSRHQRVSVDPRVQSPRRCANMRFAGRHAAPGALRAARHVVRGALRAARDAGRGALCAAHGGVPCLRSEPRPRMPRSSLRALSHPRRDRGPGMRMP